MYKCCIIIPNYNHDKVITETVNTLLKYDLPICIIDDASNAETKQVLNELSHLPSVSVETHQVNQGKGGAVKTGLRWAREQGFSHAIQIDADGQHNTDDVDTLLEMSRANPEALISGFPEYDESVPKGRLISRYITHFWVWVETLSLEIKDSMCGFRCYPVQAVNEVLDKENIGSRMDFDIEIMVHLFWYKIDIIQFPTKVIYPEEGVSHFRLWHDNALITKMHTRLFFGMLWRLPSLIKRKMLPA